VNAQESLDYLNTLLQLPDAAGAKAAILTFAAGGDPPLPVTDWNEGDPDERTAEYMGRAMNAWGAIPIAAVRAMFFPLATDPGDVDDFGNADPSADQTPRPGMLSALGEGWYGTTRGGQTFATCFVTIKNNGATASLPFKPGDLTLEASGEARDDGGTPTFVTTSDPSIYTGIDGSKTLAAGASIPNVPVRASQIGSYGSVPAGAIDTVVTQSFGNLVVTASTAAIGSEREDRADYIERCLRAPASNAPGGPDQAYLRAMNTANDGTPLQSHDGSGAVGITRGQVVKSSGAIDCYFADKDGAADATDVASANANITGVALGVITDPIGVVPDGITYASHAALETSVDVTYSVRAKVSSIPGATVGTYTTGGSPPAWAAAIFNTINLAIDTLFGTYPVGGVEQVSGAGVLYTDEIRDAVHDARVGLYGSAVTTPATTTTALAVGHVPVRNGGATNGTLVVVAG